MPAPKKIAATDRFISLDMDSCEHSERSDCVVKAYAMAAGVSYEEALRRVDRETFIQKYPGVHKALQNVTTHHPARFPAAWADGRRYLLVTNHHMAYVEHGVAHDWSAGRAFRVRQIFEIVE
jgi:hypothetical protein